jgi:hypothetical protein
VGWTNPEGDLFFFGGWGYGSTIQGTGLRSGLSRLVESNSVENWVCGAD